MQSDAIGAEVLHMPPRQWRQKQSDIPTLQTKSLLLPRNSPCAYIESTIDCHNQLLLRPICMATANTSSRHIESPEYPFDREWTPNSILDEGQVSPLVEDFGKLNQPWLNHV